MRSRQRTNIFTQEYLNRSLPSLPSTSSSSSSINLPLQSLYLQNNVTFNNTEIIQRVEELSTIMEDSESISTSSSSSSSSSTETLSRFDDNISDLENRLNGSNWDPGIDIDDLVASDTSLYASSESDLSHPSWERLPNNSNHSLPNYVESTNHILIANERFYLSESDVNDLSSARIRYATIVANKLEFDKPWSLSITEELRRLNANRLGLQQGTNLFNNLTTSILNMRYNRSSSNISNISTFSNLSDID